MDIGFYNEHGYIHIHNIIPEEYLQTAREKGIPLVKWSRENINKPAMIKSSELQLKLSKLLVNIKGTKSKTSV